MRRAAFIASLITSIISLAACSSLATKQQAPVSSKDSAKTLQASWVVMGENGQAIARAITTDNVCPALVQDGIAQTMSVRALAGTVALRKTASKPEASKPSEFPVLTCEAPLSKTTKTASIAGQDLPVPKAIVQKIVVVGDSGCRLKASDNYFQPCNDGEKWAFRSMVEVAAKFKPDLVLHVGDYQYRENPCPEGHLECAGSPWGYGWDTWQADFFSPAQALLNAAPWVMVRGNHEICTRAGQGWWRFMDPRPLHAGRDCNLDENDLTGDFSAPYAVPLGSIGGQSAQLIVFDSSKVPYKPIPQQDAAYQIYVDQMKAVNQLAQQADFNLFTNHHPILGMSVEKKQSGGLDVKPGNGALQEVMKVVNPDRLFSPKIQVAISGHVHLFEALTFSNDYPTQFVSGNGGSSLDTPLKTPLAADVTPYQAAQLSHFSNSNDVGFMTLEREQHYWKVQAWNKNGKLITECQMHEKITQCHHLAE